MFIGDVVKERLDMFGFSTELLAENTMMDSGFVDDVLSNRIPLEDIDDFDIEILSNALYCNVNYFSDKSVRSNDVVFCSMNRGIDTVKSNLAKAKIQSFMKDMIWIKEALC